MAAVSAWAAKGEQAALAMGSNKMDSAPQVSKGFGAAPCLAVCMYVRLCLPRKRLLAHPHVNTAPAGRPSSLPDPCSTDAVHDPYGKRVGGSESGPGTVSPASKFAIRAPVLFGALKIETEAGTREHFSRAHGGSSPGWAAPRPSRPLGEAWEAGVQMPPLDVEPHSSARSCVADPQVSSWDAGSWRQPVQRPGWSGRGEGSAGSHCMSCRKTSPSEGQGTAVWGWAGGVSPSLASGVPGLRARKRRWFCLVPPKAQAAGKAQWHRAGVGRGSVPAQRARGRLAGPGRR